jgi:hypothetical protein
MFNNKDLDERKLAATQYLISFFNNNWGSKSEI